MKLDTRKHRSRIFPIVISLLVAMLLISCANKEDGHTYIVDYTWDSTVRLTHVKDAISGKEILDPGIHADIRRIADRELPNWIALSKLKVVEGTFHIQFFGQQNAKIVETSHGIEGLGSQFIRDPRYSRLMMAAHDGNTELARDLLKSGESLKETDQLGNTALIAAIASDKPDVLRLLIENGADVNARNKDGETALTLAMFARKPDLVNELTKHGAVLDCRNPTDQAALESASKTDLGTAMRVRKVAVNCERLNER